MRKWTVTRRWTDIEAEASTDAIEASQHVPHTSVRAIAVRGEPVFTLTVLDTGEVIIDNDAARPVSDVVELLRQVADGFESGDARRVQ